MIVVVGIGADGMPGLAPASRAELARATVVYGSRRQLDLLDDTITAQRRPWPSPMLPALRTLLDGVQGDVHVVASGDPLLHGVGGSLIRLYGPDRVAVLPHVSVATALTLGNLRRRGLAVTAVLILFDDTELEKAYGRGDAKAFNRAVVDYDAHLKGSPPPLWNETKVHEEAYFNHVAPFYEDQVSIDAARLAMLRHMIVGTRAAGPAPVSSDRVSFRQTFRRML